MNCGDDLNQILRSFKIDAFCIAYKRIRNISLYDIKLEPGTRVKEFQKYLDEISLILKIKYKPMVKLIPEMGIIRLEVVEDDPPAIPYFSSRLIKENGSFPVYLGGAIDGSNLEFDISKNPHTLIGGCTGSGKSTLLHILIANALATPNTDICIIDSKNVEFDLYKNLKNVCLANSFEDSIELLTFIHEKMEDRYNAISKFSLPSNYFSSPHEEFRQVIIIVDEYADMVMQDKNKQFHNLICRLAQKCRAAGIYCVLATQRPSVDIISGAIKANFPARISCQTASGRDSRVILDSGGAEFLAGMGDAIIKNYKYNYQRFQIAYTTPEEITKIYE